MPQPFRKPETTATRRVSSLLGNYSLDGEIYEAVMRCLSAPGGIYETVDRILPQPRSRWIRQLSVIQFLRASSPFAWNYRHPSQPFLAIAG